MTCTECGFSRRTNERLCCAQCPLPTGSRWIGPAIMSARCRCGRCGVWLELERRLRVPPKDDYVELTCVRCQMATRSSYTLRAVPLSADAADMCFGLPLWLQTSCCGETLWAFNARHVMFLRGYLAAQLREKSVNTASVAARLPRWLKCADRDDALRAVERLELRLLESRSR